MAYTKCCEGNTTDSGLDKLYQKGHTGLLKLSDTAEEKQFEIVGL